MIWKQTGGGFLQMKHIFIHYKYINYKYINYKYIIHYKSLDIFFTFNLYAMQITRCHIFKEKGHLFYINSLVIKRWLTFIDEGHLF